MSIGRVYDPTVSMSLTEAAAAVLESRSDYRVAADFAVEIHSRDFNPPLPARARDLSAGGICIATPAPFVLDGVHALTMHLPSGPLRLDVHGRWQKSLSFDDAVLSGIAFSSFTPAEVSILWDVVHDTARELGSFVYKSFSEAEPTIDNAMSVAQISRTRIVGRRKLIYQRGLDADEDDSIFIVRTGQVHLHLPMRAGNEVPIADLGPGDLFGGLAMLASIPHFESARTNEETMLLEISRASFSYMRLAKPLVAHWLGGLVMRSYLGRLGKIVDRAVEVLHP